MKRSQSLCRLITPLLAATLYTGLSGCGPAPTASPSAQPSPQASPTAPGPTSAPATGMLRLKLQADASLAAFSTAQQGAFNLCFASVAAVETRLNGQTLGRRPLSFKELLAGIDVELGALPAGPLEGQTHFLDTAGASIGFVSWQTELPAAGRTVSIRLSAGSETQAPTAAEPCPSLNASIEGGSLRATGGSNAVAGPSASPAPGSPSPAASATPSSAASAPAAPANLQLVERGTSYLTLKWDFATEPVSYRLYLDGKPVAENHTSPDYFRFTDLTTASGHTLGVQAVTPSGVAGEIASLAGSTLATGSTAAGNFSSGGNSGGGTSRPRQSRDSDEFQVSSYTPNDQFNIDVAVDDDGNYVVVWESYDQDGDDYGVYGQRFDADGEPKGEEFQINPYTMGSQERPRVDMDSDGDFVVVWSGAGSGDSDGIYARRFEADGDPVGTAFVINNYVTGSQSRPDVSLNDDGSFVVVWQSANQNNGSDSVYGRVIDAGNSGGSVFLVNSYTSIGESAPVVASDADGNFVVAWHGFAPDEYGTGVYYRRFDALGSALATPFHVNTFTTNSQSIPHIAMDSNGDFVVAWESDGQDGDGGSIYARRFASEGDPLGDPFLVNETTESDQYQPDVAIRDSGEFVVTWTTELPDDDSGETLYRIYDDNGEPVGDQIQANQQTEGFQGTSAVAMGPDGDVFVLWENNPEPDGDQYGVYGRFYRR